MRHCLPITLLVLLCPLAAHASSVVAPPPVNVSPSIIHYGALPAVAAAPPPQAAQPLPAAHPLPGEGFVALSPSVIAVAEPAVEPGKVSAIASEAKHRRNPHLPPMVIRGGIFGDPFARSGEAASEPAQQASGAPAPGIQSQAQPAPQSGPQSGPQSAPPGQERSSPGPAAAQPPARTKRPE